MKYSKKSGTTVKKVYEPYTVIRDTKEKANFFDFPETNFCRGTVEKGLITGDYTLDGMEDILSIERKANTGEFSGNISEARFFRELERLNNLKHAFLVLEFELDDLYCFPLRSEIPSRYWPKLRVSSGFLLKKLIEIQTTYTNVQVIFAGKHGPEICETIFKRINQLYAK